MAHLGHQLGMKVFTCTLFLDRGRCRVVFLNSLSAHLLDFEYIWNAANINDIRHIFVRTLFPPYHPPRSHLKRKIPILSIAIHFDIA